MDAHHQSPSRYQELNQALAALGLEAEIKLTAPQASHKNIYRLADIAKSSALHWKELFDPLTVRNRHCYTFCCSLRNLVSYDFYILRFLLTYLIQFKTIIAHASDLGKVGNPL